jgi:ABC-type uncharacterized transport system permease subunit
VFVVLSLVLKDQLIQSLTDVLERDLFVHLIQVLVSYLQSIIVIIKVVVHKIKIVLQLFVFHFVQRSRLDEVLRRITKLVVKSIGDVL